MILIDTPFNDKSHLVASSIRELHSFCGIIGIKRCWFQNKQGKNQPHYDIVGQQKFILCIGNGAKFVQRKELLTFLKENYGETNRSQISHLGDN